MLDQAQTTELPDGGVEVVLPGEGEDGLDAQAQSLMTPAGGDDHFINLADRIDGATLSKLGTEAMQKIKDEDETRTPWLDFMRKALGLLGLTEIDTKSADYEDDLPEGAQTACSLMLTAIQKWISNASREMGYIDGPITAKHIKLPPGMPEPQDKQECLERVEAFFNQYLKAHLPAWFNDMDRTLMNAARMGSSFKKVYADPQGPVPVVIDQIDPQHLIVQADARALYSGVAITHYMPNKRKHELLRQMEQGFYRDFPLTSSSLGEEDAVTEKERDIAGGDISIMTGEDTSPIYERHCWLMLDEDRHPKGLARPYILTIMEDGEKVLRLQRNWAPDDISEKVYENFIGYMFQPGDSAVYAVGLGQLLYAVVLAIKSGTNSALASAWLSNHQGGFKSAEFSIEDTNKKSKRGEFQDVQSAIGDLSKMIMPFPFKGPEPALIQMLEKLDSDARELAGVLTMNVAESANSNTAPGTMLAALDEASVIPASSHVRIYLAFEEELRCLLHAARRVWGKGGYTLEPGFWLAPGDLDRITLHPRMRPGAFSRQRRIAEAQTEVQVAKDFPQLHDMRAVLKRFYAAIGSEDIDEIVPPEPEVMPSDPVSEAKTALEGKPLKSGLTQDHQSHIRAHTATVQMFASRPELGDAGQGAAAALQAHIGDHLADDLAVKVAGVLGIPLQAFEKGMPPPIELQVAPMVAQAIELVAKQLSGQGGSPEEIALQIEQLRGDNAKERELIKSQTQITTTGMKVGQQKEETVAKTAREVQDDLMALRIHVTPSGDAQLHAQTAEKTAQMGADTAKETAKVSADTAVKTTKIGAEARSPRPSANASSRPKRPSAKAG